MRIVCQKCATAYAIDDQLVTARGIRTQCPRCKHLQTARREDPADSPTLPFDSKHLPFQSGQRPAIPGSPPGAGNPPLAATAPWTIDLPPEAFRPPEAPQKEDAVDDSLLIPGNESPKIATTPCRECGVVLTDPVDRALGVCESCRLKQTQAKPKERPLFTGDTTPQPAPAPAPLFSNIIGRPYRTGSHYLADVEPRRRRVYAVAAVVLLVGLGGAAARVVPRALQRERMASLPPALQAVLPRWRLASLDLSRSASDYLAQGRTKLAQDDRTAYAEAEEAFQKALVLDPENDAALVGYAEAVALGRGGSMDEETYREALGLVEVARARSGAKARTLIAQADLLMSRPELGDNLMQARALAEQALAGAQADERPEALLALARTYLSTSARLAIQHIDEALKASSPPKRAYYYRAMAHQAAGEYRAAMQDLQTRLALDPDQRDALRELARSYLEVGEEKLARALYLNARDRHPDELHFATQLAALDYQLTGDVKEALALRSRLREGNAYGQEDQLEAWIHIAAAQRIAGELDGAAEAGAKALALAKADPAAHFQLFLLGLQRGKPEDARAHLPFLKTKALDGALAQLLEGRLLLAEGKFAEAYQAFRLAVQADRRRTDALLQAGAAASRAGRREDAFASFSQAIDADPTRLGPQRLLTRFFLKPGETLEGAEGAALKLAQGESDMRPALFEGLMRFHRRDLAGTDALMQQVLAADENNALAFALRSLVASAQGDKALARTAGERAVKFGRQVMLAHYALGLSLIAGGKEEPARKELRIAQELSPSFAPAEVLLAELDAKSGQVESARARLVRVLEQDPTYLPAKRALYGVDR